jgi:serine/threonine-protein kinase
MVVGTPEYMAPEQARGQPVGPMTDLYALGVVAFEMVTGRLPFTGTSPVDLLMKHVDARPPRPSEFVPELPAALDAFILQMLTKDPEARPGSAEQLRRQLQRLRDTLTQQAQARPGVAEPARRATPEALAPAEPVKPEPAPAPEPVKPQPPPEVPRPPAGSSSSRRLLMGAGALALVAVGGGLAIAVRGDPTPQPPPQVVIAPPEATRPQEAVKPPPTQPVVEAPLDAGTGLAQLPPPAVAPDAGSPVLQASTTETPDNPVQPAGPAVVPETPAKRALTQAMLLARIRKLDKDIDTLSQSGQKLSPATRRTLEDIRRKAESATSAEERRKVAKELDGWEKFFLRRK